MNELNPGMFSITTLVVTALFIVAGLIAWFFVNRASSRTNTQIALLEELLDQQKRQNALLRRLCDAKAPKAPAAVADNDDDDDVAKDGLVRMVAER
ncbi:hypothetical protein TUM12370_15220 [Salmonella enterica subsp. enterica serovar Choleraesuis]|nr:hypothetical protein TUM12370_15220 [Salmonella enterica subsp. enterica serovar Choleraesuis]